MRAKRARGVSGWVAATAVPLLLSGALVACGDGSGADPVPDTSGAGASTTASTEASSEGTTETSRGDTPSQVADPEHAVDPPGKFESPLTVADVLIVSEDAIDDETVDRIRDMRGVESAARLSVGQVPIENAVYNVAAVDPASYRNFTTDASAQFQEQWERVAGGELAMPQGLRKRLPIDDDGFLRMGPGEEAPEIHVGAFAPQVPTIDLVVNEKWGETLGLPPSNALVVSTRQTAPQKLRKPIERLVGEETSVQLTDIASRLGLDPDAFLRAVFSGTYAQAVGQFKYQVSGGRVIPDPAWVREHITTDTVPILGRVTCNKSMMPQLKAALGEIVQLGLADKIHPEQFAGCYYPRFIAGSTKLSNHAFGLALDINVPGNQRGTVGEIDRGVVAVFKRWGFAWGGDWGYTDPMHFELAEIKSAG